MYRPHFGYYEERSYEHVHGHISNVLPLLWGTGHSRSSQSILHSHQQCSVVPVSPHPHQHLLFSTFELFAIPTDPNECEVGSRGFFAFP